MKRSIFFGGLVLLASFVCAQSTVSSWPQFQGSGMHQGYFAQAGPNINAYVQWSVDLGTDISILSSPILDPNNNLYIGGLDSTLYVISQNGRVVKTYFFSAPIRYSAVNIGFYVYCAAGSNLYLIDCQAQEIIWQKDLGTQVVAPLSENASNIYCTGNDGRVHCFLHNPLEPDSLWISEYLPYNLYQSSPTISLDGQSVFISSLGNSFHWTSGLFYELNQENGSMVCFYSLGFWKGDGVQSTVTIDSSDRLYFASKEDFAWGDGTFYQLADGCLKQYAFDINHTKSSGALFPDGTYYVGTEEGLRVIKDGSVLWTYPTGIISSASPVVDAEGVVYVVADNGVLFAIDANSSLRWSYSLGDLATSAAFGYEQMLYVVTVSGQVFAFKGTITTGISKPLPPFRLTIFPNPFSSQINIFYQVPKAAFVKIEIFDIKGRLVKRLVSRNKESGSYHTFWLGLNEKDQRVATGIYFCKFHIGEKSQIKKIVFLN